MNKNLQQKMKIIECALLKDELDHFYLTYYKKADTKHKKPHSKA